MHQIALIISISTVFYLFMVRPQQQRQQAQQKFIDHLKRGTDVVTIGGIHGKVHAVKDSTVTIEVDSKGSKLTVAKRAIAVDAV